MSYHEYLHWKTTPIGERPVVSVVIPAYNEQQRVVPTIGAIAAHLCTTGLPWELIVSDDGSTDDTVALVRSLGLANVTVLDPGVNRGKGAAVRDGVLAARGELILFSDADLSTPIEEFDRLAEAVADGAEVAIASRAAVGADESRRSPLRRLVSGALRGGVRRLTGVRVGDTQCGFKLFTRHAARALFAAGQVDGFSFDLEVLWLAQRWGYEIAEVPVRWIDAPGSKVRPLRESVRFLRDVGALRWRSARGVYPRLPGAPQAAPDTMRVALVTAYPPSTTTLNEYGYHLARHLAAKPEVGALSVLCDDHPGGVPTDLPAGATAVPCWRYGSPANPLRIVRAVRRERPDVVLVNAHFTSFGAGKVAATLGLLTPLLLRLLRVPSVVLLHNLVDTVDLEQAGFSSNPLVTRLLGVAGRLVTRLVLVADRVAVTIPQYVDVLRDSYAATNVYLAPHGSFEEPDRAPSGPRPGPAKVLAFGKWGTYKRVEELLDAHRALLARGHDLEVIVAGTDSHNAAGYLAGVQARYADLPGVTFTGYVAEEDVAGLFTEAAVAVFPYTSTTGSSGVLHQAGSYGCAAVLPDIGDFAQLVREEGFAAETFAPGDAGDLADAIERLLVDPERRVAMGEQNRAAACGIPLADVADWHLLHLADLAA